MKRGVDIILNVKPTNSRDTRSLLSEELRDSLLYLSY